MTTNKYPENQSLPANIMLEKWADIGFEWQGNVSTAEMARLKEQTVADSTLQVIFRLVKQEGIVWLNYQVTGQVQVACQRCLDPLDVDVSGVHHLALLESDEAVGRIGDAEYILMEELGTGATRKLPIKDILEDELLLMLPLSPKHDDCDMPVDMADEEEIVKEQENPFAALAQLKGKLS
ncbi:YceD family protein [Moraxella canis]|uniref:Large ribosomal RNA subunit accumulation protein YceD n=1 Tax=Moraxella canis TaxID=90239 RepID=A0A1S9ZHY6_9GAMM|nr:YceD family protein [Moraxella canis]OOR82947.1 hypothetical protein B0180_08715 [Moraxella canis]